MDARHQRELDDYARAQDAAERCKTLGDLEDAGFELEHLETKRGFDRYEIGFSDPVWACPDCGSIECSPEDGCEACGFGAD
jgi:hypothetical protein